MDIDLRSLCLTKIKHFWLLELFTNVWDNGPYVRHVLFYSEDYQFFLENEEITFVVYLGYGLFLEPKVIFSYDLQNMGNQDEPWVSAIPRAGEPEASRTQGFSPLYAQKVKSELEAHDGSWWFIVSLNVIGCDQGAPLT